MAVADESAGVGLLLVAPSAPALPALTLVAVVVVMVATLAPPTAEPGRLFPLVFERTELPVPGRTVMAVSMVTG